ncbi:MAG: MFS transporter [Spirochaetota bacterium]
MIRPASAARRPRSALVAFAAMASVYFFSYIQRTAIPGTIFDELQVDFGLAATSIAAIGALFTWIYGGMQVFVGILVDGWGGRRNLIGGGLAMVAGSLLFPLAHSLPLLLAARALTGLGASFIYLAIVKEIHLHFSVEQFPMALGSLLAVGYCGGVAATLPFERTVAALGWRQALILVAVLSIASLAAAVFLSAPSQGRKRSRTAPSFTSLGLVLANRSCWPSYASSLISFPIYFVILTILGKKFLQDRAGLGSAAAAAVLLAMTVMSALSVTLGGLLPRMVGGRNKPGIMAGSATIVVGIALLLAGALLDAGTAIYLAGYVLLAIAIGISGPSSQATVRDLNRPELLASGISVMNALAYLGCGSIAQVCGMILDGFHPSARTGKDILVYPQSAYVALFCFLLVIAVLNFGFTAVIPETGGRNDPTRPVS